MCRLMLLYTVRMCRLMLLYTVRMCRLMLLYTGGNKQADRELHTALSMILVQFHNLFCFTVLNYYYFRHGLES
jgi:hypothetical protein